jgi:hypothetical protein
MVEADGDDSNVGWTAAFSMAETITAEGGTASLMIETAGSGHGDIEGHP